MAHCVAAALNALVASQLAPEARGGLSRLCRPCIECSQLAQFCNKACNVAQPTDWVHLSHHKHWTAAADAVLPVAPPVVELCVDELHEGGVAAVLHLQHRLTHT